MKHLKHFENIEEPQVGDYVLCDEYVYESSPEVREYTLNNIGQCVEIDNVSFINHIRYGITYNNIPKNLLNEFADRPNNTYRYVRYMKRGEIKYFSNNLEDLEIKINANIYNI